MNKETLLTFPCSYPIKIIGNADNVESIALPILRAHIPDLKDDMIIKHSSQGDKYLALTVTFNAVSQEQIDALYIDLSSDKRLLMVL